MRSFIFIFLAWLATIPAIFAQEMRVIFDTDMDSDVDDVGALAMLPISLAESANTKKGKMPFGYIESYLRSRPTAVWSLLPLDI